MDLIGEPRFATQSFLIDFTTVKFKHLVDISSMSHLSMYLRPKRRPSRHRSGAIAVIAAVLLIPMAAMLAFAVDYGYLLRERSELQRAADAAALAGVQDLIPDDEGVQDVATAMATVQEYVAANMTDVDGFNVADADIEIGRFNPDTIYDSVTLLQDGTLDTIRVTLRRDGDTNPAVPLFFANVFGMDTSDVVVTATAVLQKARYIPPGSDVLPFSIPQDEWNSMAQDEIWNIYGDGRLEDSNGHLIPGNWGTVDIGNENNSTADLSDQIVNGLRQHDLDALHGDGRIPTNEYIDGDLDFDVQADTGLSGGMKHAVRQIHGQIRLIPIYNGVSGNGNNTEFSVVDWAVCQVVDSNFKGAKNTYVRVKKAFLYDGDLRPQPDLSVSEGAIAGAYTVPVLVE